MKIAPGRLFPCTPYFLRTTFPAPSFWALFFKPRLLHPNPAQGKNGEQKGRGRRTEMKTKQKAVERT